MTAENYDTFLPSNFLKKYQNYQQSPFWSKMLFYRKVSDLVETLKAISRESDVGKAVLEETAQFLAP